MSSRAKYGRAYRKSRYKRGLCSRCPSRRVENRQSCEGCLQRDVNRGKNRVEVGLCRYCGKKSVKGKKKCYECLLEVRLKRLETLGLSQHEIAKAESAIKRHDNRCDCCGCRNPGGRGEWCIDHDEELKVFRGLLCCGCNSALGHVKDSIKTLRRLILYLKKSHSW